MIIKIWFVKLIFVCLILGLVGCAGQSIAPTSSQPSTPELTTSLIMEKTLEFKSVEDGFALDYPADWTVKGEGLFWVKPSEIDFHQDYSSVLTEVTFTLHTSDPYTGHNSRRWRIPQTASENLQWQVNLDTSIEVVEPVRAVSINERDAATVLLSYEKGMLYQYGITLRIAEDKMLELLAQGPSNRSEEMRNVLNAIALNIRPLDEE